MTMSGDIFDGHDWQQKEGGTRLGFLQSTTETHNRNYPIQNVSNDKVEKSFYRGRNSGTEVKQPAQGHTARE